MTVLTSISLPIKRAKKLKRRRMSRMRGTESIEKTRRGKD